MTSKINVPFVFMCCVSAFLAFCLGYAINADRCGPFKMLQVAPNSDVICDELTESLHIYKNKNLRFAWKRIEGPAPQTVGPATPPTEPTTE